MEEQRNKVKSNKAKVKEKMSVINCCSVLICPVIKQPQNTKLCAWRLVYGIGQNFEIQSYFF